MCGLDMVCGSAVICLWVVWSEQVVQYVCGRIKVYWLSLVRSESIEVVWIALCLDGL